MQGETAIKATVADAVIGVKAVEYRWEKGSSSGDWKNMSCPTSTCSSTLDTTGFQSGEYNITVRASDNLNHQATKTVKIVLPSSSSGGSGNQSSTTPGSNRTSLTPGCHRLHQASLPNRPYAGIMYAKRVKPACLVKLIVANAISWTCRVCCWTCQNQF